MFSNIFDKKKTTKSRQWKKPLSFQIGILWSIGFLNQNILLHTF